MEGAALWGVQGLDELGGKGGLREGGCGGGGDRRRAPAVMAQLSPRPGKGGLKGGFPDWGL